VALTEKHPVAERHIVAVRDAPGEPEGDAQCEGVGVPVGQPVAAAVREAGALGGALLDGQPLTVALRVAEAQMVAVGVGAVHGVALAEA
jgi:hypothetical protein